MNILKFPSEKIQRIETISIKLSIESPKGRRRHVVVEVEKTDADDDGSLMNKASTEFRRRHGFADRVVAIYVEYRG